MLKSETKEISGTKYEVTQLPYTQGKRLLVKLYKVLGPALGKALASAPELGDQDIGNIQLSALAPALAAAVEQLAADLDEDAFDLMVDTLGEYTFIVDDKGLKRKLADDREFRFAGNYLELFQWLGFALRVNFLGFTSGRDLLAGALARAKAAQGLKSQPQ